MKNVEGILAMISLQMLNPTNNNSVPDINKYRKFNLWNICLEYIVINFVLVEINCNGHSFVTFSLLIVKVKNV